MNRAATRGLVLAGLFACPIAGAAEQPVLLIPRLLEAPVIERYMDGRTVPPGVEVTGLRQREPGDGVPVSQRTAAYLWYDAERFYAVFICHDEPGQVRANMTRREGIEDDDKVALVLDTYHDGQRAYMFITNPLGIQMDGVASEGQDDDYSYDALWHSEGRLTADGYVVVMAIPFKSLRFASQSRQTWGVAVVRAITRNNETSFWPYITRRIASLGQQLATLEGVDGVSPGRNLQAIPYGSFASARYVDEEAGTRVTDRTGRAGVDAKAVVKDALTLDLTVNPDFSQIESDEPQVTINQRFEVFFPEKRPFFIENAGYFETPEQLFFSRRIADPSVGARVTGKIRGWAFGGLLVDDEEAGREVSADDPRYEKHAGIGVVRVQREFARQSYLGAIFTDRELGPASNRVLGVDGRWRLDDNWAVTGQVVGSRTDDVGKDAESGSSGFVQVSHESRAFDFSSRYVQRSPAFRADLGFIPRVDLRETEHEASYSWFPVGRRVLQFGPDIEVAALWDYGGELQDWNVEPGFEVELPRQTEIGLRHWQQYERFEGQDFRRHRSMVYASSQWLSWLAGRVEYVWGTGVNYYPADGLEPFLGRSQAAEAGLTLRPLPQLRLDETYLFTRLSTRDDEELPAGLSGGDIFNNHIVRSRVDYQFTRELSARAIIDYEAILPNEALVSLEREKRLGFDLLATYLVNPWTALYVGYTDAYANVSLLEPFQGPPVRNGAPTTSVGRQVFVKISYLLRY